MLTLYGIKNCDSVKKARRWLDDKGIEFRFHDFREDGLEQAQVAAWLDELGWETLLNKRSSSWKALDQATRDSMDQNKALSAIMQQPTLIKRPLLDTGKARSCGFSAERYQQLLSQHTL